MRGIWKGQKQRFIHTNDSFVINGVDKRWLKWMDWGKRMGCHQKPERSFFIKGYQFPVCARCTGVLASSATACAIFPFYPLSWQYCMALCGIMFLDWLVQAMGIRESTNIRRLLTGLAGGFGFMTLQLYVYQRIFFVVIGRV